MKKLLVRGYTLLIFFFLYLPIIILVVMSFNESKYGTLPFSFSLKWYRELAQNTSLISGAMNSIYVAGITAIVSVILATMFVSAMVKSRSKWSKMLNTLSILPLTIPWIILGLALLLLLNALGLTRNFFILMMGHVIVSFPYAVLVIQARFQEIDFSIQEASYTLGASRWTTFARITLPMIYPALLAGALLAFMISIDNFIISYFLLPVGGTMLPVEIYSSIKYGFTPEINALSTIIITGTILVILLLVSIMRSSLKSLFK